jgi:hypothetical protein
MITGGRTRGAGVRRDTIENSVLVVRRGGLGGVQRGGIVEQEESLVVNKLQRVWKERRRVVAIVALHLA